MCARWHWTCLAACSPCCSYCAESGALRQAALITGNPVKLLLALVSVAYDVVLIAQHYRYNGDRQQRPTHLSDTQELGGEE